MSATANNGWTIKAMGFSIDGTEELETTNVFVALANHRGLGSLAGVATGQATSGGPGLVRLRANNVLATVQTFPA